MAEQGDRCFIFFDPKFKNSLVGEFVSQDATSITVYLNNKEKQISYSAIKGGIYTCSSNETTMTTHHAGEILKLSLQSQPGDSYVSVDLETGNVVTGEF